MNTKIAGRQIRPLRVTIVLMAVLCVVASACSSQASGTSSTSTGGGGNINIGLPSGWNTLDPSGSTIPSGPAGVMITGLYDRLVTSEANGTIIPYLATSWTFPNSASIKFNLRSGVVCQDGTRLTAQDIANSMTRLFTGPDADPFFGPGTPKIVANNGANTLTFTWPNPNPDAIAGFALPYASVICPAGLQHAGQLATTPAGSGPYTLKTSVTGVSATLVKNPAWKWGPSGMTAADLPSSVTLSVVENDTTTANELITGQLDIAQVLGPDVKRLNAQSSLNLQATTSYKVNPLTMNATSGHVTADPQVRRAIMTAINPEAWLQAAYQGEGVTSTSIFTKNATCYDPSTAGLIPTTSITAARSILTADGYVRQSNGIFAKDGKPLTVTLIGSPAVFGQGTEYIDAQLTQAGIAVKLEDTDRETFVTSMREGSFDVGYFPIGSANVPSSQIQFIAGPLPPNGVNFSYYVDPQLNAATATALYAAGPNRCAAWDTWQMTMLRNYDMLPLGSGTSFYYVRKGMKVVSDVGLAFDLATLRRVG